MKRISVVIFMFIIVSNAYSASYVSVEKSEQLDLGVLKRIAILPFGFDQINQGVAVSGALTTEFLSFGFDVVERTQLNAALHELKLDITGVTSYKSRKQVGKFLNVDAFLKGTVSGYLNGNIFSLDMRLIDVKTGDILLSANYLSKSGSETPFDTIKTLSDSLRKELSKKETPKRGRVYISHNENAVRKKYAKVALLPLLGTDYYGEGSALIGALTTEFIGNGVRLVERDSIEQILKEQFRYTAGFYVRGFEQPKSMSAKEDKTIVSVSSTSTVAPSISLSKKDLETIGNLTGAQAIIIGSFSPKFPHNRLFAINFANLRLIDIETGRIQTATSYYNANMHTDEITVTAALLALSICPVIKSNNIEDQAFEFMKARKRKSLNPVRTSINNFIFPAASKAEWKARRSAKKRL